MENFQINEKGIERPPSAIAVIRRIGEALGHENWMNQLQVQSETVRTWKKRDAVPIAQIAKASALSGRPMEWFTRGTFLAEQSEKKFAETEKQVIHLKRSAADEHLVAEVVVAVLESLENQGLTLSKEKIGQLVELIYEHETANAAAAKERGVRKTTERFLRLVAA